MLFVRLAAGVALDAELQKHIRVKIAPAPVHAMSRPTSLPSPTSRVPSPAELAVRDVVHVRALKNNQALAKPKARQLFRDLANLAD